MKELAKPIAQHTAHLLASNRSAAAHGVAVASPPYGIDCIDEMAVRVNPAGPTDSLANHGEGCTGLAMGNLPTHDRCADPTQLQTPTRAQETMPQVEFGQEEDTADAGWNLVQQVQGQTMPLKGMGIAEDTGFAGNTDTMDGRAALLMTGAGNTNLFSLFRGCSSAPSAVVAAAQRGYIGDRERHHIHAGAGIAQPHYKNGNDKRSRISLGENQNYKAAKLREVIDALTGREGEPGARECIEWCQQQLD